MKSFAAGAFLAWIVATSNVVAGGVCLLLGTYVTAPDTDLISWIVIMGTAVWCAVTFLQGAIEQYRIIAGHR